MEKILIPILRWIKTLHTRNMTLKYPVISREYSHPSHLKFHIINVDRMVTVVIEEKDIVFMLVAVCFVVCFLDCVHQICNSYILLSQTGK